MIRLLLLILLIYAFVQFYKKFTAASRAFREGLNGGAREGARQTHSHFRSNSQHPPFEDIEEAEYIEVTDKDSTASRSS